MATQGLLPPPPPRAPCRSQHPPCLMTAPGLHSTPPLCLTMAACDSAPCGGLNTLVPQLMPQLQVGGLQSGSHSISPIPAGGGQRGAAGGSEKPPRTHLLWPWRGDPHREPRQAQETPCPVGTLWSGRVCSRPPPPVTGAWTQGVKLETVQGLNTKSPSLVARETRAALASQGPASHVGGIQQERSHPLWGGRVPHEPPPPHSRP